MDTAGSRPRNLVGNMHFYPASDSAAFVIRIPHPCKKLQKCSGYKSCFQGAILLLTPVFELSLLSKDAPTRGDKIFRLKRSREREEEKKLRKIKKDDIKLF